MRDILRYTILSISVVILDQLSKWFMLPYKEKPLEVTRFLTLSVDMNRGISWGLFNSTDNWLFLAITILIITITLSLGVYACQRYKQGHMVYGELLVIAGSISNIIDRIVHQGVVDFIAIHIGPYTWPVFNVADVAIVLGVALMLVQYLLQETSDA